MHAGRGRGGNFPPRQLDDWAKQLARLQARGKDVFVYFNNDGSGFAVANARALRKRLS
jgi:uncharacterized protein YecE (DUF72 family)